MRQLILLLAIPGSNRVSASQALKASQIALHERPAKFAMWHWRPGHLADSPPVRCVAGACRD